MADEQQAFFDNILHQTKRRCTGKEEYILKFISSIDTGLYSKLKYASLLYLIKEVGNKKFLKVDRRSMISLNTNSKIITYYIDSIPFIEYMPDGLIRILNTNGLIRIPTTSNNYHNRRLYDFLDLDLGYYKTYNGIDFPSFLKPDEHGIICRSNIVLEYDYQEAIFKLTIQNKSYPHHRTN